MMWKMSFMHKALIKEDLKRYWPISIVYLVGLFALAPMHLIGGITDPDFQLENLEHYYTSAIPQYEGVLTLAVGIILCVLLFGYLHKKKTAGMIHAYPITRKKMFFSHIVSGFILLIIPALINTVILQGLVGQIEVKEQVVWFDTLYSTAGIWNHFLQNSIIIISVLAMGTFAAMVTGIGIVQGGFTLIFMLLPFVLISGVVEILDRVLYGFDSYVVNLEQPTVWLAPILYIIDGYEIHIGDLLPQLLISMILFGVAYWLYKKRNIEQATEMITFSYLIPIFKYGVAFCAMSFVGLYLQSVMNHQAGLYIGLVIGAYIGYIIAEMSIQKSIWVFHRWKGYAVYMGVILILILATRYDILGYGTKVPDVEQVEGVIYDYPNYIERNAESGKPIFLIRKPELIQSVINIQKEIISHRKEYGKLTYESSRQAEVINFDYVMKNGKVIRRGYKIPITALEDNIDKRKIVTSESYKKIINYDLFEADEEELGTVILSSYEKDKRVDIEDPQEREDFIYLLKQDILQQSYEEMVYNAGWGNIRIEKKKDSFERNIYEEPSKYVYLRFDKDYDDIEAWLKQEGYLEKIRIMPEEVEYIEVGEMSSRLNINIYDRVIHEGEDVTLQFKDHWKITEEPEIEEILQRYEEGYDEDGKYFVKIQLKDGNVVYGSGEENMKGFLPIE